METIEPIVYPGTAEDEEPEITGHSFLPPTMLIKVGMAEVGPWSNAA